MRAPNHIHLPLLLVVVGTIPHSNVSEYVHIGERLGSHGVMNCASH